MQVLVIGKMLQNHAVRRAAEAEGVEVHFMTSAAARAVQEDNHELEFDAILAGSDRGDKTSLTGCALLGRGVPVIPVSVGNIVSGMSSVSQEVLEKMAAYFTYGGQKNLRNGFRMLRCIAGKEDAEIGDPEPVPFNAIFTSDGKFYDSVERFFTEEGKSYDVYAGIVNYRNRWLEDDTAVEQAVAESLNKRGIGTIMAFTTGEVDESMGACGL